MTNDNESADDEKSLFARILRRSADELEEPDDGDGDGADSDVEQRADDEDGDGDGDEMDEAEQEADPVDAAIEDGTISASQASAVRDVAERMDEGGVQTLIDAISENDLDVDDAVEMIEAYDGDAPAPGDEDDDNAPEELKARSEEGDDGATDDAGEPSDEEIAALQERLEAVDELGDRLDDIEQRLDERPTSDDVEEQVAQRLEEVGEELDEEFEDLIQRAEVVGSPNPTSGETEGKSPSDIIRVGGD